MRGDFGATRGPNRASFPLLPTCGTSIRGLLRPAKQFHKSGFCKVQRASRRCSSRSWSRASRLAWYQIAVKLCYSSGTHPTAELALRGSISPSTRKARMVFNRALNMFPLTETMPFVDRSFTWERYTSQAGDGLPLSRKVFLTEKATWHLGKRRTPVVPSSTSHRRAKCRFTSAVAHLTADPRTLKAFIHTGRRIG